MLSKKSLSWIRARVPISCLVLLALLSIITISPIVLPSTHAESATKESSVSSRSIETLPPSVALAIDQQSLSGQASEELNGGFSLLQTGVSINVSNVDGFKVYLASTTPSLKGQDSNSPEVPTLAERSTGNTMVASSTSTWGYSFTSGYTEPTLDTIFSPIPSLASTPIYESKLSSSSSYYTLAFAAKFSKDLPADTYTGAVTLSVVSEPQTITLGLEGLAKRDGTMQELTPEICRESDPEETVRLKDSRDGTYYWVARLADGNCWMTQNLALDITEAGLSSSDTNITEDWNATSEYPPEKTYYNVMTNAHISYNTNSWNLGKYVILDPESDTGCGDVVTSIDVCVEKGLFANVSNIQPYTGPGDFYSMTSYEQDGVTHTKPAKTTVDEANGYYDAHYLIGNYYSYNAATAGTGATLTEKYQVAPGNICPKGWDLPLSGAKYNNTSGSFYNLLNQYHLFQDYGTPGTEGYRPASAAAEDDGMASPLALIPGTKTTVQTALTRAPLYYTYSGSMSYNGVWHSNTYSLLASKVFLYTEKNFTLNAAFGNYLSPSENYQSRNGTAIRCYFSAN